MISHEFDIFIVTPRPQIAQNCRYPRQQPAVLGVEMITDGLLGQLTLGPALPTMKIIQHIEKMRVIIQLSSPLVSPGLPWSPLVPAPVAGE